MTTLNELYQEIILDHYRHPRGRGELEPPKSRRRGSTLPARRNHLRSACAGWRIQEIRFRGRGCSISQASASMLTEAVQGKTVEQARALIQQVLALVKGETEGDIEALGDIAALAGVRYFPVRVKCATLGWHTLDEALKHAQ
jgi:nitrogen fixation NifU-like protein